LKELATHFEGASGDKLVFRFGATPELIEMAKSDPLSTSALSPPM
jgi:hypothetical protein